MLKVDVKHLASLKLRGPPDFAECLAFAERMDGSSGVASLEAQRREFKK